MLQYSPEDNIDVITLPELSFMNEDFDTFDEAYKHACVQGQGPYYEWAKQTAIKFKSVVVHGYLERDEKERRLYNSMLIVSEKGEILKNYRKHLLYYTEVIYITPGPNYEYLDIKIARINQVIRFGLAICNDIWTRGEKEYELMEFANFHKENNSQIILGISNWPNYEIYQDEQIMSYVQVSVWLNRMIPIFASGQTRQNKYLIWNNCCGRFNDQMRFVGSSCILQLTPQIKYVNKLNVTQESVLEQIIDL
ncbi:carbon-nitrogen family protein [Stylonychia lemnae]|uniref:Carbon-nitrogen family protein n=1 Tax=Stylonychia lemnae TaxID=5949 RepID=A0A078AQX0_STYLE|nr:carbon-nitrogen family protein [Stylonychia lemnae]|eukprot:CDW83642.1 carbon-nitrogen family protein [Stylonychia lemnae]